jgi:hypothetical protein
MALLLLTTALSTLLTVTGAQVVSPENSSTASSALSTAITSLSSSGAVNAHPTSTTTEPVPTQTGTTAPTPLPSTKDYAYLGCYNETTSITIAGNVRALADGTMESLLESMTVEACAAFCLSGGYVFAGLEYAQECWCANLLNVHAAKLADDQCELGCVGNNMESCGGSLKLSVYKLKSASA